MFETGLRSKCSQMYMNDENSNNEEKSSDEIFNDFEGFNVGNEDDFSFSSSPHSSSSTSNDLLSNLLSDVREKEAERDETLTRNWNRGNWKVRGFALDKNVATNPNIDSPDSSLLSRESLEQKRQNEIDMMESPIYVCKLAVDEKEEGELVAVGRSNGSICVVRVGTDFMTSFTAVPRVSFESLSNDDDQNTQLPESDKSGEDFMSVAKYKSEMVRSDLLKENGNIENLNQSDDPFEIVHQFHHNGGSSAFPNAPISALLYVDESSILYSAMEGSGEIREWSVSEEESVEKPLKIFDSGIHSNTISTLRIVHDTNANTEFLLSTSLDGSFALWDRNAGTMIKKVTIPAHESSKGAMDYSPIEILCADVEQDDGVTVLYFGLNIGQIVGYELNELLLSDAEPRASCRFSTDPSGNDGGVTAIKCAGAGTVTLSSKSTVLISGGENGGIKQWEMISRNSNNNGNNFFHKVEHWPRLSTQRLQSRAHVFKNSHYGEVKSIQILTLRENEYFDYEDDDINDDDVHGVESTKLVITASRDGSIYVSSAHSGEICYSMDGFTDQLSSVCLCNDQNALITDGMDHFVCVHDFDTGEDIEGKIDLDF